MNQDKMKTLVKNLIPFYLLFLGCNCIQAQLSLNTVLTETKVETPRISPIPQEVEGIKNPVISLNGTWKVAIGQGVEKSIQVPGELVMQGFDLNIGETAHYKTKVEIPKDWTNKRIFIRFDAVSSHALVKVNNSTVVEHEGSFVPFETEITEALKQNDNQLQVDVQANTISDILASTSQYAAHTVAGILRKVTLFVLPKTNISDITINTVFDKKFRNANLNIETKIESSNNDSQGIQLRYSLFSGKKQLQQKTVSVNSSLSKVSIAVKKPYQWNPESPYLYELSTELIKNGKAIQTNKQKIGFRQVAIKGSQVYVNGKAIKLRGVNRHSIHPLTGRSLSPTLERLDAELFKKANCNFIRTSHYPPSEEFLKAADSLGLFIESEAALAWIGHPAAAIWGKWDYKNERLLPYMLKANIENIEANKNHPSVIIWSLGNESLWSPLWNKVKSVVKHIDTTRPLAFHDQIWGEFNNNGSTSDIANFHYPDINGPARTDTINKPVLFGEFAHLSTYNRRELLTDPGIRDAYNAPLVAFYDSIYKHPNNLGGAIWSGIDDTFHLPNGKIAGYGPWGPIDGWRRPKPEYFGMKKAFSPIKIKEAKQLKGKLRIKVENRYDFTALSAIKIKAEINGEIRKIHSKILPRQEGYITIPSKKKVDHLKLTFYNANGLIVEQECFDFTEKVVPGLENNKQLSYSENKASYLIKQGNVTYRVSKINGTIVSVKKENKSVLTQGPRFTVVAMNSEDGGKGSIAGETYQRHIEPIQSFPWPVKYASNITIEKTADDIQMTIELTFKKGKGKLWYIFKPNGQFVTKYEIEQTTGEDSPYQYGLMLQLPKTFENLSWKRKGDFSSYPQDHIGRNQGTAKLNAKVTTGVEPWREQPNHAWKDDANELGSNDFKSTKRNIYQASLTADNGTKITVLSNTKQGSRTWLQEEHINWLISDYSNNGSEPFYDTPHSNGRITTKDKVLKGTLILSIE
ncbi:glycoside hydrolase family 2 TIM barrel-domain containing protein [Tamlana sp. 2201CG12-4]|uniref:glycoside hydrolase family 2 protein n=1 Tax=Tamlana sp. 2201CG12-4 TaxID=3112582 RepID=UPI002DBAC776|nr:glycoside hydrolase family 2 TIM barrel-domain containing protein [Tamlana sp. 2201CG12-4]MEC3907885.1 glycoside hydrolase family 2 TIM barrel-domain containing protein [Tamlana sp. 2201CG12-4]